MRRLFSLFALLTLAFASPAFAVDGPSFDYAIKKASEGQKVGSPTREIKLVRYASSDANATSIVSGDVLIWDSVSDDGVTITRTATSADGRIAGIAVTTIQSSDHGGAGTSAQDDQGGRNWGYMLVSGPGSAKITAGGGSGCNVGDGFYTSSDQGAVTTISTVAASSVTGALIQKAASKGGFFLDACDGTSTAIDVFVSLE